MYVDDLQTGDNTWCGFKGSSLEFQRIWLLLEKGVVDTTLQLCNIC